MPDQFTSGTLRRHIAGVGLPWSSNPTLPESTPVVTHSLGGDPTNLRRATEIGAVDLKQILLPTPNDFIRERRKALGLVDLAIVTPRQPVLGPLDVTPDVAITPGAAAPVAGAASAVDWRVRWGWPWITTVQDQDGCESCWAFCATAVVESMARIEHFVWSKRSEGDVHDGMGAKCANGGDPAAALNWIASHGICDPACYPWRTNDPPYTPTPDRNGRTVKISPHVELGNIDDQKKWLDTVGPLGVTFSVYHDFDGYANGVYIKGPTSPTNYFRGYHCVCIVGYDDTVQGWLMKNSWGTG